MIFRKDEKGEKETGTKEREQSSNIESVLTTLEKDLQYLGQEVRLAQQILSHLRQEKGISIYNARTLSQITLIATKCQTLLASAQSLANVVFGLITITHQKKEEEE